MIDDEPRPVWMSPLITHPDGSRNRTGDQQIRFSHLNQYDG